MELEFSEYGNAKKNLQQLKNREPWKIKNYL
jgi:hypothetical protein